MGVFDIPPLRRQPLPGEDTERIEAEIASAEQPDLPFEVDPDLPPTGPKVELRFTGQTGEYYRLWMICSVLSLLSLSLYRPWAKLRIRRYLASHWHLNGAQFDVQYDPWVNLRGRLLVIFVAVCAIALFYGLPRLQPLVIVMAFAAAPWLMTQSNRFNWQSISLKTSQAVLHLGFWGRSALLCKPFMLLGAGLAFLALGYDLLGDGLLDLTVILTLLGNLLVFVLLYPRASSYVLYQKFAYGKLGRTRFTFYGSPKTVIAHLFKFSFSGPFFLLMFFLLGTQMFVLFLVKQPDVRAISLGLIYLATTVASLSFARTRRLNFVIHRTRIGGLSFTSTLEPIANAMRVSSYAVLAVLTLGLSIPWSTMVYQRWRANHLFAYMQGDWSQFAVSDVPMRKGTAVEELAQQFNFDLGL
ncbi:DUF898 family protein [Variovorax sp. PCZ-1]|uniref:DUF898 family protein n=1 Tax=Variovorax sp. PCZ-1 TaxID=2835533 RepID=UPI001BCEA6A8|nr:DUF898 family protein [Variovorax sp. PCZ-1]MBS7807565.1 DUF898 family protein [Variovorax sp. PCZ-1]